jgi:phosphoribosylformimino-5-aminoimidazole carboxamide ribotide isomerase
MLGPGNDGPAKEALQAWPGGLQVGGGINDKNAKEWMDAGAEKVLHRKRLAQTVFLII